MPFEAHSGTPGEASLLRAWCQIYPWIVPEGSRAECLGHAVFLLRSCAWRPACGQCRGRGSLMNLAIVSV